MGAKKIILKESQLQRIIEARMDGFRIDVLRGKPFATKVRYCNKMLGAPIGNGSSRTVYQLDDETVLKLAKNPKGIAQNEEEYRFCKESYTLNTPKVHNGSDDTNYEWIITDYLLPAKASDFKKVLGIPFKDVREFIWAYNTNRSVQKWFDKYENNDAVIDLFYTLQDFYANDISIGDFVRICNWGLCMRDGEPTLLPVDIGLTKYVFDTYYRR